MHVSAAVPEWGTASASPESLSVTLSLDDPEVVAEILSRPADERDRFLKQALRIGVLSLRMANGQVDATEMRAAGERLIGDVRELLTERAAEMSQGMGESLRSYFDPQSGMLSQRLASLVNQDGELSRLLTAHLGEDESVLASTLARHLGQESPLFRMLSPDAAEGLQAQLAGAVEAALVEQRDKILGEFSLDKRDSALRRLIEELEERHKSLRNGLAAEVEEVVKEFSLDKDDSALSRLVNRVEKAQHTITSEFSLDKEGSALSRMSKLISDFRGEVRESLAALSAQRKEADRSTRHGEVFEDQLASVVERLAQHKGDIFERTGATTGVIRNCKVGDAVVELGPESPAAGARIVFEAKQDAKVDLKRALGEAEQARKNRAADICVFVFSARSAPEHMDVFNRDRDDLIIVWDAAEPMSEVYLRAAYATARALSLRAHSHNESAEGALHELERATRAIEKQIRYLADIKKSADTARHSGLKIGDRAQRMAQDLAKEVEHLNQQLAAMRQGALFS